MVPTTPPAVCEKAPLDVRPADEEEVRAEDRAASAEEERGQEADAAGPDPRERCGADGSIERLGVPHRKDEEHREKCSRGEEDDAEPVTSELETIFALVIHGGPSWAVYSFIGRSLRGGLSRLRAVGFLPIFERHQDLTDLAPLVGADDTGVGHHVDQP